MLKTNWPAAIFWDQLVWTVDTDDLDQTDSADIYWYAAKDIRTRPDFGDDKLYLHVKAPCCGGFLRIIYSVFKQDYAGLGRREAHLGFCGNCGAKLGPELRHAVSKEGLEEYSLYFGIHKGKRLKDVPTDYLKWCASNLTDTKVSEKIKAYLSIIEQG